MDKKMKDLMAVADTWWGKKWIESMLQFGRFYRMQRGIRYTKENRVSNLIIKKGQIFAQCQGTAPTPYRIKLRFKPIPDEKWEKMAEKLSKKSIYEAELLSGIMPENINALFQSADAPLFPPKTPKLDAECTCPDPEIPCKHIAAVILSVAQLFDYDPFLLMKLRGKTEKEFLETIERIQIPALKKLNDLDEKNNHGSQKSRSADSRFIVPNYSKCKKLKFTIRPDLAHDQIPIRLGAPYKVLNDQDFLEVLKNTYKDAAQLAYDIIFK